VERPAVEVWLTAKGERKSGAQMRRREFASQGRGGAQQGVLGRAARRARRAAGALGPFVLARFTRRE
jgi:hypothetical protein